MEITFIRTPAPGGNGKRYKPSSAAVRGLTKTSPVTIKNKDNLCCARAIVTIKKKSQQALPGYQIRVIFIDPPHMLIFVGPTPSDNVIRIIKEDDHYDGCNSFSGFLPKSYFFHECNRGYDHDDHENHPCDGKWCLSCHRKDCPDFTEAKRPLGLG